MFSDLPRYTMKSIRRCPQCEHFNGYRANTCRNKKCKHPLKLKANSKTTPVESCQIVTNFASPKCISVRVRNKGPDYRAFVELNKIQNSQSSSKLSLTVVSARCNVTFCVRSTISNANDVPGKLPRCTHIEAAMNCSTVAESLNIKQYVFNMLTINERMQQEILKLNSDPMCPLVQRVGPRVMVVRTPVTKKRHLGYLHISFFNSGKNNAPYSCNCDFNGNDLEKRKSFDQKGSTENHMKRTLQHCLHFYLCVCAFASNRNLFHEFKTFVNLGLPNFQESDLDGDDIFLSSMKPEENVIELAGDISSQEIAESVLSPFVSQMIELPDGNGHMIELQADLQQSSRDLSFTENQENNDVIICKSNFNSNEVVKACDVLLANSADNLLNTNKRNLSSLGPLDIQILLSDNGNLISLSDVVDESSEPNVTNGQSYQINNSESFLQNNSEIINIQEVALQKPSVSNDIYTVSSDDTSLKIISLEQYESLFTKANDSNSFSNSDCNESAGYNFNSTLIDNSVEILNNDDSLCQDSDVSKQNTFHNIYIPDADEGLFSLDNNYELLTNISQCESNILVKNCKKRKKNANCDKGKSSFTVMNNINNGQCFEFVENDNFNFSQTPTVHIDNNTDIYLDNSTETFLPATNGMISNIITLNEAEKSEIVNPSNVINLSNYSTKYFVTSNKDVPKKAMKKLKTMENTAIAVSKEPVPQYDANFSFLCWLSSATESVNQSMHYQCNGKPDALVFHIPQVFFDCLQERISNFGTKKRLPNVTSEFVRKKAVPLGKFTMYTWNIINVFQVKKIFDTADIALDITRFFRQNSDGTYIHIENPSLEQKKSSHQKSKETKSNKNKTNNKHSQPIKITPREMFLTYLKVGNTAPEQKVPNPFCIQWIPNILPKTKVGELRLKFEFGHKNNYIPQNAKN